MAKRHTPGPWIVQQPSREDPELAIIGGGVVIADMYGVHDTPQANAKLIAAAPELLLIVQRVFEGGHLGHIPGMNEKLHALLARIKGEV